MAKSLHDLAVGLCEGAMIEFNSLFIRAKVVEYVDDPCDVCDMDCLCHEEMSDLCAECDAYDGKRHKLVFA